MLAAYAIAAAVALLSLIAGHATCRAAGLREWSWLEPAVGLAVLLVVARLSLLVPGGGWTAVGAVAAVGVVSACSLRERVDVSAATRAAVPLIVIVGLAVALPFIANGRYGLLGVSVNNDPGVFHLGAIDQLRVGAGAFPSLPHGYPLAPHTLVAAAARVTGNVEAAWTGLLFVVPLLTALTALAALRELAEPWRTTAAALTGLAYLVASALVEAANKEPIVGLLLLASAIVLGRLGRGTLKPAPGAALLGLLAAASVATFAWPGLLWPAGAAIAYGVAELLARRDGRIGLRATVNRLRPPVVIGVLVVLAGLVTLGGLGSTVVDLTSHANGPGGNIPSQLGFYEGLGIYPSADFRFHPHHLLLARLLGALAVVAALYATAWFVRRRELAIPAAVATGAVVYIGARGFSLPYNAAKALVIVSPVVMLMTVRALFDRLPGPRRLGDVTRLGGAGYVRLALTAVFVAGAAWSSALALRGAEVGDRAHAASLDALRPLLHGRPTLFLGNDDYSQWRLRGVRLAEPLEVRARGQAGAPLQAGKTDAVGSPRDFDSVAPRNLDAFDYAVTTRTAYASLPPPNWRRVAATRFYVLYQRRGPTPASRILPEGIQPGLVLNCATPAGRALARRRGSATVRPAPVLGGPGGWRRSDGTVVAPDVPDTLESGQTVIHTLDLPPGRYDLSIQFLGAMALEVRAPGLRTTMPPNLESPGPWFSVGTITSRGRRLVVSATAARLPWLSVRRTAAIGAIAATPLGATARSVPLGRACGRYIDHYRLDQPA